MKLKLIFFLFCLVALEVFAQTGIIKGRVVDKEFSEPLIGANVIILTTTLGAATDINGFYEIRNILPGTYSLRASCIGYSTITWQDIKVTASEITTLNFELEEDSTLSVFIVKEKPYFKNIGRGCGIVSWSIDMLPISELYSKSISEMLKKVLKK